MLALSGPGRAAMESLDRSFARCAWRSRQVKAAHAVVACNPASLVSRAEALVRQGKPHRAIADLIRILAAPPSSATADTVAAAREGLGVLLTGQLATLETYIPEGRRHGGRGLIGGHGGGGAVATGGGRATPLSRGGGGSDAVRQPAEVTSAGVATPCIWKIEAGPSAGTCWHLLGVAAGPQRAHGRALKSSPHPRPRGTRSRHPPHSHIANV